MADDVLPFEGETDPPLPAAPAPLVVSGGAAAALLPAARLGDLLAIVDFVRALGPTLMEMPGLIPALQGRTVDLPLDISADGLAAEIRSCGASRHGARPAAMAPTTATTDHGTH